MSEFTVWENQAPLAELFAALLAEQDRIPRVAGVLDEDAVRAKFGVGPDSIPDYLALVGDDAYVQDGGGLVADVFLDVFSEE